MTQLFIRPKTVKTKFAVRYVSSFPIHLPIEKVDLYRWVTEMSDADYQMYSPGHKAMSSYFKDGVFFMNNVENIGNETIIQHYELKYHSPYHVQFYSPKSIAFVLRWFPAKVGVPWEMNLQSLSENSCQLTCMIGADFPNLFLKIASWCNGLGGFFLKRHLQIEGNAFASDIERKFK